MNDNRFYFPQEYIDVAKSSGIDEIARKIYEEVDETLEGERVYNIYAHQMYDYEEIVDNEIRLFVRSSEYSLLNPEEQRLSLRAFQLDESYKWAIKASPEYHMDRLFNVQEISGRVACRAVDRLTLSGAGGQEFINLEPEIFNEHAVYGFRSRLEFMQFAGAWLCNMSSSSIDNAPKVLMPDNQNLGMQRLIEMGGDIHGDFRIRETLVPSYGSITPFGIETAYAPIYTRAAAAGYHSVETSIVTAICAYVIDSEAFTNIEKQRLFEVLLTEIQPTNEPELGASFYGDFGDDYMDEALTRIELDGMRLCVQINRPYMSTLVVPGDDKAQLIVRKNEQGEFELQNSYAETGLSFKPKELPNLLALFLDIGKAESRTSKNSIVHALLCAQQELKSGAEAGHIILGENP